MSESLEIKEQEPQVEAFLFDEQKFNKDKVFNEVKRLLFANDKEGKLKEDPAFSDDIIEKWFDEKLSVLVLLKKGEEIIGYAVALDDNSLEDFKSDFEKYKNQIEDVPENPKVLYGYSADIEDEHKRKRYYWKAMILRIQEGVKRGYDYFVLDATGEGFASKFPEYFGDFIVFKEEKNSEEYGNQTFFVIDLKKIKEYGLDNFLQELDIKLNVK